MLSSVVRFTPAMRCVSRRVAASGSQRSMCAIGEKMKGKEKVEEDRYMRAQDNAWKEKLRELKAQEKAARESTLHSEVVEPVMKDVAEMLKASGDKVSDAGLETLAKWKLDL